MTQEKLRKYYEEIFNQESYTVDSFAEILEVKPQAVYQWINEGKLEKAWLGITRIPRHEAIEFCLKRNRK